MNTKLFSFLSCAFLFFSFSVVTTEGENDSRNLHSRDTKAELPKAFHDTYHWLEHSQLSNGLLESTENGNFVSLYDNALAALLFIEQGDFKRAEKIFDFFNARIDTELLQGPGGFFQFRDRNGNNGSRTWMGDNAWLLIALNHYHKASDTTKYKRLSLGLEQWIRSLQDKDGGLWGGQRADGSRIHKVTEGIITAFNAVGGYDSFHKGILSYLKNNRWNTKDRLLVAWPNNKAYYYALDLHALGYGIFENFPEHVLHNTNRYLNTQSTTMTGEEITGYGFDEDKDVVWFEGTAQMAIAFHDAGYQEKSGFITKNLDMALLKTKGQQKTSGLPYASNPGSTYGKSALWKHADTTPAISSTVWYLFTKMQFNPLALGKQKNIPKTDQFWISGAF